VNNSGKIVNKPLLVTAVIMFTLSTAHIIVQLVQAITAFIQYGDVPNGPHEFYASLSLPLSVLKLAIYVTNNVIADGLVIYRCYIVWGSLWSVLVVPITMLIGTTICGYRSVYNFSQGQNITPTTTAWGDAMFILSLLTNLLVTTLIASRIYWIGRRSNAVNGPGHSQKYNYTVAIVLESGALYLAPLVILLVLFSLNLVSAYIVYAALAQIMGLAPTIIIVRVGLGISTQAVEGTVRSERISVPLRVQKVVNIDTDGNESDLNLKHEGV
jgi:hypothetical protein